MGVPISWLMVARKTLFALFACSISNRTFSTSLWLLISNLVEIINSRIRSATSFSKASFFNLDSSFHYATELINLNPKNSTGYYYRGVYFINLGKSDQAIADLTKALELSNNNHIWARVALGYAYCILINDLEPGFYHIKLTIMKCPQNTKNIMYYWLVSTLINLGAYEKAEQYIQESMNVKPGCYEIHTSNLIFYSQGQYDHAKHFTDSL